MIQNAHDGQSLLAQQHSLYPSLFMTLNDSFISPALQFTIFNPKNRLTRSNKLQFQGIAPYSERHCKENFAGVE